MKLEKIPQAEAIIHELKAVDAFLSATKLPLKVESPSLSVYRLPIYNPKRIILGHGVDYNATFCDEQLKAEVVQSVKAYKCRLEKELLEL